LTISISIGCLYDLVKILWNVKKTKNKHNKEIGWDGMDWLDLAQGWDQYRALVNTVMNLRVP
jgi:hypothetical protein